MNNTFSIKRFRLLFKKTVLEKPLQMIGFILLMLTLSLIAYAILKNIAGFNAAQNLTFIWGLSGGGFFLASFVFGYFGTNASGCSYLTLPASYFEKWLCGILIAGVLYPVIFFLFYHLIDLGFVAAYHNSLDPDSLFYKQQYESVYTFDLNGILAWKIYIIFFFLTGAMLTGAMYFNKTAFIKTAIAICAMFLFIYALNWLLAKSLFSNVNDAWPYDHITLAVGKEEGTLLLPSAMESFYYYGVLLFLPAVLWLLPLIRLKEKEF